MNQRISIPIDEDDRLDKLGLPARGYRPLSWDGAVLFPTLPGESEKQSEARRERLIDPTELEALFEEFPVLEKCRFTQEEMALSLVCFLSYYKAADVEKRASIKESFGGNLLSFIHFFQLCEFDWSMGDELLKLAQSSDDARLETVLLHAEELLAVVNAFRRGSVEPYRLLFHKELEDESEVSEIKTLLAQLDKEHFSSIVSKEIGNLLREANESLKTPVDQRPLGERCKENQGYPEPFFRRLFEHFSSNLCVWGALFAEAQSPESNFSVKDLENLLLDTNSPIVPYQGMDGGPSPEVFSMGKDYERFKLFVREAYREVAPVRGERVIESLPQCLQDRKYHFLFLKMNKDFMGLIRWTEEGEVAFFFVDPECINRFALGAYLQAKALAAIPPKAQINFTVLLRNTAAERLIDRMGAIAIDLIEDEGSALFSSVLPKNVSYRSKDTTQFSRPVIRALAEGKIGLTSVAPTGDISVELLDLSPKEGPKYLENIRIIKAHFKSGEVLTRIFYDRDPSGKQDLQKSYLVFERKQD